MEAFLFKPGLKRAVVMGGLGFIAGALLVILLRGLQQLDPVWDIGTVLTIAVFAGLGGFVTGLGLFNPARIFAGQAGLPRAVSMGIIGFLLGALIVLVLRGLQGLEPLWDTGLVIIMSAFTTTGFFVWGMGAFDPRLSVHGEHAEEVHAELQEEAEQDAPTILGTYIWQVSFYLVVTIIVIAFFALLPTGPGLHVTADPEASTFAAGQVTIQLPFNGPTLEVSQLVIFVAFVIFTLVSLTVVAGLIGLVMFFLNRNVEAIKGTEPTIEERTPPRLIQILGRISGAIARWLRGGLPRAFQK